MPTPITVNVLSMISSDPSNALFRECPTLIDVGSIPVITVDPIPTVPTLSLISGLKISVPIPPIGVATTTVTFDPGSYPLPPSTISIDEIVPAADTTAVKAHATGSGLPDTNRPET